MPQTTTYGYDAHGNIVKKTLPNGETIAQSYDALNRVTAMDGQRPSSGGQLYRYAYRYDLAGNVVHIREDYPDPADSWREITQLYDRAHRLTTEKYRYSGGGILGSEDGDRDVHYSYDAADNRTSREVFSFSERTNYSYNNLNQLTEFAEGERLVEYEYDLNGNRIVRTEEAEVTGYEYDYEQRLVTVTDESLEPVYAYTYDYRTRRVEIEATAASPAPGTTTVIFSGGTSVQEYSGSALNVEYIRGSDWGGGIGGILYTIREGDPSFTHYNSRGDVVAKTDASSTLTYQAAYEAYGTRSEETGSTLDRQKANTKDEDPTGLLNEGFRYRDLETGEFITRDPAGFVDGPNLYTYVRQNPWTKFDPKGLRITYRETRNESDPARKKFWDNYRQWFDRTWKTPSGRQLLTQAYNSDTEIEIGPPVPGTSMKRSELGLASQKYTTDTAGKPSLLKVQVEIKEDNPHWTTLIHEVRHAVDFADRTTTSTEGVGGSKYDAAVPRADSKRENRGTRTENVVLTEYADIIQKELQQAADAYHKDNTGNAAIKQRYFDLSREDGQLRKQLYLHNTLFRGSALQGELLPEYNPTIVNDPRFK